MCTCDWCGGNTYNDSGKCLDCTTNEVITKLSAISADISVINAGLRDLNNDVKYEISKNDLLKGGRAA